MLHQLELRQFRCFDHLKLDLSGDTLLIGDNAQGKTSLLESICLLLRLQSPRSSKAAEMIQFGKDHFLIEGVWGQSSDRKSLRYSFTPGQKRLAVNNKVQKRSADYLAESGKVVWIANSDMELLSGSSAKRRYYMDFIGSQLYPDYRDALHRYEKARRARNKLLKAAAVNWSAIDAFDPILIENGSSLIKRREQLIEALRPWVVEVLKALSEQQEDCNIRYLAKVEASKLPAVLEESRELDRLRGQTSRGPHRDELEIEINGRVAANFGSEGQQRSLALALKLAQAQLLAEKFKTPPVLLLDDIFGELDTGRRNALLDYLPSEFQKLITTTNIDWRNEGAAGSFQAASYRVESGALSFL